MPNLGRLRKMRQRQGTQILRNEAYFFCVGRSDEECSVTQHMDFLRSHRS